MAEAKTQPTRASVADFLNAVPDETRRKDAKALDKLMRAVSGAKPVLWGPSIVGYGRYTMTYANGKTAEWMRGGFSPRGNALVVYLVAGAERETALLRQLGPHKLGKSCLYLKRLADVNVDVLRQLIEKSYAAMAQKYPT